MGQQMHYIANKGLGFDKENRVLLTLRGRISSSANHSSLPSSRKHPGVLGVATSSSIMGRDMPHVTGKVENNEGAMTDLGFNLMPVGDDFISVMGIEVVTRPRFLASAADRRRRRVHRQRGLRARRWAGTSRWASASGSAWPAWPRARDRRRQGFQLQIAAHATSSRS